MYNILKIYRLYIFYDTKVCANYIRYLATQLKK